MGYFLPIAQLFLLLFLWGIFSTVAVEQDQK